MLPCVLIPPDCVLCVFPDEINWPEGEDAPPPDSQELITLLLRQNPLERMGTGTETKGRDTHTHTHCNSVSTGEAVNPPVTLGAASLFQVTGEEIEVTQQWRVLSCDLVTSSL